MTPSVIVSMVVALVGIFTFLFSIIQSRQNVHVNRAKFFKEIIDKLRFDEDMIDAMNILDYDSEWYNDNFPKSKTESQMDKLFAYLSYVCYLKNVKVISNQEFELIEYKIKRACQNINTQYYLKFVNRFARKNGVKHTFHDLILYMEQNVFNNNPAILEEFENGTKFAIKRDYIVLGLKPTTKKKEDK